MRRLSGRTRPDARRRIPGSGCPGRGEPARRTVLRGIGCRGLLPRLGRRDRSTHEAASVNDRAT